MYYAFNLHSTISRTQMDNASSQFTTVNGNRHQTEISPMHAAAVNGDKSSLAKLLTSKSQCRCTLNHRAEHHE